MQQPAREPQPPVLDAAIGLDAHRGALGSRELGLAPEGRHDGDTSVLKIDEVPFVEVPLCEGERVFEPGAGAFDLGENVKELLGIVLVIPRCTDDNDIESGPIGIGASPRNGVNPIAQSRERRDSEFVVTDIAIEAIHRKETAAPHQDVGSVRLPGFTAGVPALQSGQDSGG